MERNIIIFDGECNLCNGVVHWLLKAAPQETFQFVPFQSPYGQQILQVHGFPLNELETVILLTNERVYTHSEGFLRILSQIPKWHSFSKPLLWVPRFFRDGIYNMAAKNRVQWFGKSRICSVNFS